MLTNFILLHARFAQTLAHRFHGPAEYLSLVLLSGLQHLQLARSTLIAEALLESQLITSKHAQNQATMLTICLNSAPRIWLNLKIRRCSRKRRSRFCSQAAKVRDDLLRCWLAGRKIEHNITIVVG